MTCHNTHQSGINHCFPHFTVEFHPLIEWQCIDTCHHMLVTVINAIPGEVFATCRHHSVFLQPFHHTEQMGNHFIRIITKCTDIGNRIIRIQVQVCHRRKGPMHTVRAAFMSCDPSHFVGIISISGRRDTHWIGEMRGVGHHNCAVFLISGYQKRNFGCFLDNFCKSSGLFHGVAMFSADKKTSEGNFLKKFCNFFCRTATAGRMKQRCNFFFHCH